MAVQWFLRILILLVILGCTSGCARKTVRPNAMPPSARLPEPDSLLYYMRFLDLSPTQRTNGEALACQEAQRVARVYAETEMQLPPAPIENTRSSEITPEDTIRLELERLERRHANEIQRLKSCRLSAAQWAVIARYEHAIRAAKNARLSPSTRYERLQRLYAEESRRIEAILTPEQHLYRDKLRRQQRTVRYAQWQQQTEAQNALHMERDRKTEAIHAEALAQFRALLTPEQQQSFDKFRALYVRWERRREL